MRRCRRVRLLQRLASYRASVLGLVLERTLHLNEWATILA
jgi:hypothetical protein